MGASPIMVFPSDFLCIAPGHEIVQLEPGIGGHVFQDAGHFEQGIAVDAYDLSHGLGSTEKPVRGFFGQHYGMRSRECGGGITFYQGEAEHGQKAGVGQEAIRLQVLVTGSENKGAHPIGPDYVFYLLGVSRLQNGAEDHGAGSPALDPAVYDRPAVYLVNAVAVPVEPVGADFIVDPQEQQHGAGDTHGESTDIDGGKDLVTAEAAPGDFEIIFQYVVVLAAAVGDEVFPWGGGLGGGNGGCGLGGRWLSGMLLQPKHVFIKSLFCYLPIFRLFGHPVIEQYLQGIDLVGVLLLPLLQFL